MGHWLLRMEHWAGRLIQSIENSRLHVAIASAAYDILVPLNQWSYELNKIRRPRIACN